MNHRQSFNGTTKLVAGIVVGVVASVAAAGIGWGKLQTRQVENTRRIATMENKLDKTYSLVVQIATKQGIDTNHAP